MNACPVVKLTAWNALLLSCGNKLSAGSVLYEAHDCVQS